MFNLKRKKKFFNGASKLKKCIHYWFLCTNYYLYLTINQKRPISYKKKNWMIVVPCVIIFKIILPILILYLIMFRNLF